MGFRSRTSQTQPRLQVHERSAAGTDLDVDRWGGRSVDAVRPGRPIGSGGVWEWTFPGTLRIGTLQNGLVRGPPLVHRIRPLGRCQVQGSLEKKQIESLVFVDLAVRSRALQMLS